MNTHAARITPVVMLALAAVYFFWGGTYLAMRFAIETLPPFLMAGTRFILAGAFLYAVEMRRGTPPPTKNQWKSAAIAGALLLLGGNGGVVWAQQFVPSGMTAIVVATAPLWMCLMAWALPGGGRPAGDILLGLVLGFGGITLLVAGSNDLGSITAGAGSMQWVGYSVETLAALSWAAGSVYSRRGSLPASPWVSIAMQMIAGGLLLLAAGLLTGEWARLNVDQISVKSAMAFIYLIVFGSLIGFSAYIWLLRETTPSLASTYAYVNPIIAVFLGWFLAGEHLESTDTAAAAIIVVSVVLITRGNARAAKKV